MSDDVDDVSEATGRQQKPQLFKPGQSGNPKGRPKGSRNRLGEAFIQALANDFDEHGIAAIATVREERPHEYLKVVASLLPKQVEIKESAFDGIGDEELSALIVAAREALGVADEPGSGEGASGEPEPPGGLPAVH